MFKTDKKKGNFWTLEFDFFGLNKFFGPSAVFAIYPQLPYA